MVPDWNFHKYLVDHKGEVLNAWGTAVTMEEIFDEIEAAIDNAKRATLENSDDIPDTEESQSDDTKDEL